MLDISQSDVRILYQNFSGVLNPFHGTAQLSFTWSKSAEGKLEKGLKYVQSQ